MADNNYRIDLDNGTVRSLAEADELDALFAADQVRAQMHVRKTSWPNCRSA